MSPRSEFLRGLIEGLRGHDTMFTCRKCEANYSIEHLEQPVTECPVCGWKTKSDLTGKSNANR